MPDRAVSRRHHPRCTLEWAVATTPLAGQPISGDLHVIRPSAQGVVIAAIDGLGHGPDAARAARVAAATLEQYADASPGAMLRACHRSLVGRRGAVMSIASIDEKEAVMTWTGIGDVAGVLTVAGGASARDTTMLVTRAGILGAGPEPTPYEQLEPFGPGSTLVLATDGVDPAFGAVLPAAEDPQALADDLLRRFGKSTDDALVLVARCHAGVAEVHP